MRVSLGGQASEPAWLRGPRTREAPCLHAVAGAVALPDASVGEAERGVVGDRAAPVLDTVGGVGHQVEGNGVGEPDAVTALLERREGDRCMRRRRLGGRAVDLPIAGGQRPAELQLIGRAREQDVQRVGIRWSVDVAEVGTVALGSGLMFGRPPTSERAPAAGSGRP